MFLIWPNLGLSFGCCETALRYNMPGDELGRARVVILKGPVVRDQLSGTSCQGPFAVVPPKLLYKVRILGKTTHLDPKSEVEFLPFDPTIWSHKLGRSLLNWEIRASRLEKLDPPSLSLTPFPLLRFLLKGGSSATPLISSFLEPSDTTKKCNHKSRKNNHRTNKNKTKTIIMTKTFYTFFLKN